MNIGDRVTHVDYPDIVGTIRAVDADTSIETFLVVWDRKRPGIFSGPVTNSRHIWSALKKVEK